MNKINYIQNQSTAMIEHGGTPSWEADKVSSHPGKEVEDQAFDILCPNVDVDENIGFGAGTLFTATPASKARLDRLSTVLRLRRGRIGVLKQDGIDKLFKRGMVPFRHLTNVNFVNKINKVKNYNDNNEPAFIGLMKLSRTHLGGNASESKPRKGKKVPIRESKQRFNIGNHVKLGAGVKKVEHEKKSTRVKGAGVREGDLGLWNLSEQNARRDLLTIWVMKREAWIDGIMFKNTRQSWWVWLNRSMLQELVGLVLEAIGAILGYLQSRVTLKVYPWGGEFDRLARILEVVGAIKGYQRPDQSLGIPTKDKDKKGLEQDKDSTRIKGQKSRRYRIKRLRTTRKKRSRAVKQDRGAENSGLLFGQQAVLPVDLEAVTYLAVDWGKKGGKDGDSLPEAGIGIVSDWVLLYNKSLELQENSGGSYNLEEADGTPLSRRAAASHVKRFYPEGMTDFDDMEGDERDDGMRRVSKVKERQVSTGVGYCISFSLISTYNRKVRSGGHAKEGIGVVDKQATGLREGGRIQLVVLKNLHLKFRNKERTKKIQDLSQSLDMTNDNIREKQEGTH
ncbi:hypothetical protein BY996DRAFT_6536479 [Phakopsora pachyrhizi]|nr:hypothetical protein BY996DRAFT_6536479 [Phakopsora pachyrhizi]